MVVSVDGELECVILRSCGTAGPDSNWLIGEGVCRVTSDVGKCSVCGMVRADWIDRDAGVKLCEHCYGRGMRENGRGTVLLLIRRLEIT